jgi:predicted transcriptional regulator
MDLMDRHPVTLPSDVDVVRADEEWFTRYGWSWFPVVEESGRFIGIVREDEVRSAAANPGLGIPQLVGDVMDRSSAMDWSIDESTKIEELLSSEPLGTNGALMAVDEHGVLQGVITVEQVRAALRDPQE